MKKLFFTAIILMVLGFAGSGCSLLSMNQSPNPSEQTATYESMVVEAMKTAVGELTQQALANPSATNTNTSIPPTHTPLPSPTPIPPTHTATSPPPTDTPPPATATPTSTATRTDFNCQVVSSSPAMNQTYPPGGDFDGKWTFKNTGSEIWDKEKVEFVFISGTKFQVYVDKLAFSKNINKGESIEFIIDMLAPRSAGTYTATWGLKREGTVFCSSMIQIIVK
ncbi:MAG TPA: NBR1-Ig-like domain-containing protein [Anaerolineaceae bacterium]|nr:NBR1-Ig-like domain-containing protein [Anaerolineaceae bacterium]